METINTAAALDRVKRFGAEAQAKAKPTAKPRIRVPAGSNTVTPPKVSRSIGTRIGTAIAPYVAQPLKTLGKAALPISMLQSASSEVAPESKLLPNFGKVMEINDERSSKAYEKGGVLPALAETASAFIPAIGGITQDAVDFAANLFSGAPSSPTVEEKQEAYKDAEVAKLPVDNSVLSGSVGYQAPLVPTAAPEPAPEPEPLNAVPQTNNSYFVNNGLEGVKGERGVAPGQKQYFRDLPQAFPVRTAEAESAALVPSKPVAQSPMAKAVANLDIPTFSGNESYGDLLNKNLQLVSQGASLLPARIQERDMRRQQEALAGAKEFGFESLKNKQDVGLRIARLEQSAQRLADTRGIAQLNANVRMRGQDITGKAEADKPLSYADQNTEYDALVTASSRMFVGAPDGFAQLAPDLIRQSGRTAQEIEGLYNAIMQNQKERFKTTGVEMTVENLVTAMKSQLGIN